MLPSAAGIMSDYLPAIAVHALAAERLYLCVLGPSCSAST